MTDVTHDRPAVSAHMTASAPPTVGAAPGQQHCTAALRHFVRHLVEMIVAMLVGMMALAPFWAFAVARLGWRPLSERPGLDALVMATNMVMAMSAWMRYRRHGWAATAEMAAAMYLPFVLLLIPLELRLISGSELLMLGHLLMLPAMVAAMLLRKNEYTRHTGHATGQITTAKITTAKITTPKITTARDHDLCS